MTRSRLLVLLAALIGVGLVVLYVIRVNKETVIPPPPSTLVALKPAETATTLPPLHFVDQGARSYSLSHYRGRYVLLNLWASWCAPCVRELPALATLQRAIPVKQFAVVTVDVEKGAKSVAAKFLVAHGAADLPAFADPDLKLMRAAHVYGLPTTLLIGPQGREIARAVGPADWDAPQSIAYFRALSAPHPAS